jgi:hypothetical protein
MRSPLAGGALEPLEGSKLTFPDLYELGEGHAQRVDETEEIEDAEVRLAALDRADVVAVHIHAGAQVLLAQVVACAQLTHRAAEGAECFVVLGSAAAHKAY